MGCLNDYQIWFHDGNGRQVGSASLRSTPDRAAAWLAAFGGVPLRALVFVNGECRGELPSHCSAQQDRPRELGYDERRLGGRELSIADGGAVIRSRHGPGNAGRKHLHAKVVRFRPGMKVKVVSEDGEWAGNVEWLESETRYSI